MYQIYNYSNEITRSDENKFPLYLDKIILLMGAVLAKCAQCPGELLKTKHRDVERERERERDEKDGSPILTMVVQTSKKSKEIQGGQQQQRRSTYFTCGYKVITPRLEVGHSFFFLSF